MCYVNNYPLKRNHQNNQHCIQKHEPVSKYVKFEILRFLGESDDYTYKCYIELMEKLLIIDKYRNNTLIAHGHESITKGKILEKYGDGDLEEDLVNVMKILINKGDLWIDKLR
jgi:hypothetical protein